LPNAPACDSEFIFEFVQVGTAWPANGSFGCGLWCVHLFNKRKSNLLNSQKSGARLANVPL
jgi:hypothetical protein